MPSRQLTTPDDQLRLRPLFVMTLVAVALTFLFWGELWQGGGLVGGDTYTYFYPQKLYYAERLHDGELPLWNSLAGHGYPLVAESQTGAFYPPNALCYWLWDVNTAYNIVQLGHYLLAFLFTWCYARTMNLGTTAAGLTALVYTFGWFPSRICLEWAIIGGAWLPAALLCVELFFKTRHWRFVILLAGVLALQMSAGHFNLAFITQLLLLAYVPTRLWWASRGIPADSLTHRRRSLLLILAAMVAAFGLSAGQLLPTWELKQRSQRAEVGAAHSPSYGSIPVWYWSQIILPWDRYAGDIETRLNAHLHPGVAPTNKVEAHLYFGLVTVALLVCGLLSRVIPRDRRLLMWLGLGLLALLYTPGWLLPLTQYLPGFNFFMGPGRYGIVTTLAAALLAGAVWQHILNSRLFRYRVVQVLASGLVLAALTVDLWIVSRTVTYAFQLEVPITTHLATSPVRQILAAHNQPVRLFSRGANLPTMLGVASTPQYLGIGPDEYFDSALKCPEPLPFDEPPTAAQIAWLQRAGVTHVLSFSVLDPANWPVTLKWAGQDPFLNRAWARTEPIFLYELSGSRGRTAWADESSPNTATITTYRANRVVIDITARQADQLILTDLMYPGWQVTVDGQPAEASTVEGMYRGVNISPGAHEVVWSYAPASVAYGIALSLATLLGLATIAHIRYWHPAWFQTKNHPANSASLKKPKLAPHQQSNDN